MNNGMSSVTYCKVNDKLAASVACPKSIHTFPRNFPENGEAANLLQTGCRLVKRHGQQVDVMEFGK